MKRNKWVGSASALLAISAALIAVACDSPSGGGGGGKSSTSITLAKFNAVIADPIGNTGMTPNQVSTTIGFSGTRSAKGEIETYTYQETPTKYIQVEFNKAGKAAKKALFGISFLTLDKYREIFVTTARVYPDGSFDTEGTPSTLDQINSILGVTGQKGKETAGRFRRYTPYTWTQGGYADAEAPEHRITVNFSKGDTTKAYGKALEGAFPGMLNLAKYNKVVVDVGGSGAEGSSRIDVFVSFEYLVDKKVSSDASTETYRWSESSTKYIEVVFSKASRVAISAKAAGIPGAEPKGGSGA